MTAIGLYVTGNGIVVASDGIAYDDEGIVREVRSKQLVIPDCNTAMTASASGPVILILRQLISMTAPETFDHIDECMPEICREAEAQMRAVWEREPYFAVLYGGWSPSRQEWCGRVIANYAFGAEGDNPGEPAFVPLPLSAYTKPQATPEALARFGLPENAVDALAVMPADEFACRMMLAQRHSPMVLHGGGTLVSCGVGAFCEVTSLTRDMANTQIAVRWPDEVGRAAEPWLDPAIEVGSSKAKPLPEDRA